MPASCVISNWLKEYINQDTVDLLVLHVIHNSFYSINSISTTVGLSGINVNWLYKELSVLHKKLADKLILCVYVPCGYISIFFKCLYM